MRSGLPAGGGGGVAFEHFIQSGGKRLRCGFTTGTCAALAAAGAARLLLTGRAPETVFLRTPKGWTVETPLIDCRLLSPETASAAVEKDAGDDVDATAGALIFADVSLCAAPGVEIDGGEGVGRVTKPGLDQPVGAAAINRVPRRMIAEQLRLLAEECAYEGGFHVVIRVPGGAEIAAKTFNPKLGIVGGISILGTSGIVEPMSLQALSDTVALEIRQARAAGSDRLILTPGSYGLDYLREKGLDACGIPIVKCSNFIGNALDEAAAESFASVLLVGHAGKLVKLAGGIMNTHSRFADCRTELFCAHAAICGADGALCRRLFDAATSDACIDLLEGAGLRAAVMESLLAAIDVHLAKRAAGRCRVGAVLFSNVFGTLGETDTAAALVRTWTAHD